jgi:hypothetical protein
MDLNITENTRQGNSASHNDEHDDRTETMSDSIVGECDVTNCRFNRAHLCEAGSIRVEMVNGMAHCGTYDPKDAHRNTFEMNVSESI